MRHAVIFDMDGVLVDSFALHRIVWAEMARDEGLSFDVARFDEAFGRTSREVIAHLWGAGRYTPAQIAVLDERREGAYRDLLKTQFPGMPGAGDLINALHVDGFALAMATSAPLENAELVLDKLGLRHLFPVIVTAKDVHRGKPDPEVFLLAAAGVNIPPGRCAVIEDAPPGVEAANRAGMLSIGLTSGGRTRKSLAAARLVIGSLDELSPSLIRQLLKNHGGRAASQHGADAPA